MTDTHSNAAEIVDLALRPKPELMIHSGNLPATVEALRDLFAGSGKFFDRGVPVRFITPSDGGPLTAMAMTKNTVVREAHRLCQPVKINTKGEKVDTTLSDRVAELYLDSVGEWRLPPLAGVSMSPLLSPDGSLRAADGYDSNTGLWCCNVPVLILPRVPSRSDAESALQLVRQVFRTFPYADAERIWDASLGMEVVDTERAPGKDESAFLIALMTACCRSSLWLAPGLLLTAPAVSGAGSGKGLLVRAICTIAFGIRPRAFTMGSDRQELDKRLAAELVEASPALFLDNANGIALRSDTLASLLTERPARVRLLGQTRMAFLNSAAFIALTGNGLTVTEDLARRFVTCTLDAQCEDPESRPFHGGFVEGIERRRAELLTAVLTIWRWGRQNANSIPRAKALGSFEVWAEWCRDPLVALGCCDPVERIQKLKAHDPRRQRIAEIFQVWWEKHGDRPVMIKELAEAVRETADAHGRGRQYLASLVAGLAGTRAAGYVLTRQEAAGKWRGATYALTKVQPEEGMGHRTHRTQAVEAPQAEPQGRPMPPMDPMPHEVLGEENVPAGEETTL